MIVEFIGCTGSGKSSLAYEVKNRLGKSGITTALSDQLIRQSLGFSNIKNNKLGSVLADFSALPWFCVFVCRHFKLTAFILWKTFNCADSYFASFNLVRNVIKKMGIYQYLQKEKHRQQVILVDEGLVHGAHNVFVHIHCSPKKEDIVTFAAGVPLPDMIIYVKSTQERQIERIMSRGHRRMRNKLKQDVTGFVSHANYVFELLIAVDKIKNRLLIVDNVKEGRDSIQSSAQRVVSNIVNNLSNISSQ